MREFNERHKPSAFVSSHDDLKAALDSGEPVASTVVCHRDECRSKAVAWVQSISGTKAVIEPMRGAS
jgi:hypothetical protein